MKQGESQNVEYKRSWHDEYLKWVCGFANAKGGTIWIGIDDDKSVHGVDIYPDRLEIVSPGGMPDGSAVQDLDWRNVASDRRNPTLADMFAQMDYMERKGSGLGLILDAYAKEVENPKGLEPKFFSGSGSFHVVLPNLNQGVPQDDTQGDTQDDPQGDPQGAIDAQKVPRKYPESTQKIIDAIRKNPFVTRMELAQIVGITSDGVKKRLNRLKSSYVIRRVGPDNGGHWEVN